MPGLFRISPSSRRGISRLFINISKPGHRVLTSSSNEFMSGYRVGLCSVLRTSRSFILGLLLVEIFKSIMKISVVNTHEYDE